MPFEYREAWLTDAVDYFKPDFEVHGYPFHAQVRVTCGWPSRGGLAKKKRAVGECWSTTASADGTNEIFISPVISDPVEVASVLVHELVHATVGTKFGHGKVFQSLAVKMGLTGPMRSTFPNFQLRERLNALSQQLGPYPHAKLDARSRKKQGTRLLQCVCPACGYLVRITQKWIDKGLPVCPCGISLVQKP